MAPSAPRPPFRADHVGSLLRPPELRDARLRARKGEISADQRQRYGFMGLTPVQVTQPAMTFLI